MTDEKLIERVAVAIYGDISPRNMYALVCAAALLALNPSPARALGHHGVAGQSAPFENYANGAQNEAKDGHNTHDGSPEGRSPLGYKVGLVVGVMTLLQLGFYASIRKAMGQLDSGDPATGLGYLLIGVSGVVLSAVCAAVFISGLIGKS